MANRELQLINSVLKNKDIGVLYAESADDLFNAYGDVWESVKGYYTKYQTVPDIDLIQERFPDLEKIDVNGDSKFYLDSLKSEVIESRVKRILMGAGKEIKADNAPQVLQKLQARLAELDKFSNVASGANAFDFDAFEAHKEELRERAEALGGTPGIPTGIDFIDSAYTSGFAPGDLIVTFGWTGRGKSLFSTLVCCNANDLGHKAMVVSLEMPKFKVIDRIWTIKGNGSFLNSELALGQYDQRDFEQFKADHKEDPELMVVTNDGISELTPNAVQAFVDRYHPKIVVIDYAQLASDNANTADMTARMRNMSKEYKRLAVRNEIVVVLISSATADSSSSANEPPRIEQVAWSKQLAFDADLAFAVHKHDDSNLVEIVCRKNRNGPMFAGILDWDIDRGIIKSAY